MTFRRHISYSKAAQYSMHSIRGCATSRQVSIIQASACFAMRGSDALFPNDFGEELLKYITHVYIFSALLTVSRAQVVLN